MSKIALTRVLSSVVGSPLLSLLEAIDSRGSNLLRVLTYHRIDDATAFEQQMAFLAQNYRVVSIQDILEACGGRRSLPPRSVHITFDDSYRNFAEVALPILERRGLPVTLFVPTAYPDQRDRIFWWDRLDHAFSQTSVRSEIETPVGRLSLASSDERDRALSLVKGYVKTLSNGEIMKEIDSIAASLGVPSPPHEVLGWDELRDMVGRGVSLGSHTRTHPLMDRIDREEAREEVVGSLRDLNGEIGCVLPIFAYPGGMFTDETVQVLAEAGVVLAFTTHRGTNDLGRQDPLRLRRINMSPRAGLATLRARLIHSSVYLNRFRSWFDPQDQAIESSGNKPEIRQVKEWGQEGDGFSSVHTPSGISRARTR